MNSVWKSLTFIVGERSLAWTVLFVVGLACILAFAFQAIAEIIIAIPAHAEPSQKMERVLRRCCSEHRRRCCISGAPRARLSVVFNGQRS